MGVICVVEFVVVDSEDSGKRDETDHVGRDRRSWTSTFCWCWLDAVKARRAPIWNCLALCRARVDMIDYLYSSRSVIDTRWPV